MERRTALLIDGANMFAAARNLNFQIDYAKLLEHLRHTEDIVRANYYTAVTDSEVENPLIKLIDWLSFNGYTVITRPVMEYFDRNSSHLKGNMDLVMAVDAMLMKDRIDHFILGTGDGDFTYLVGVLQQQGLEVTAISTIKSSPPMIANALRRQVDTFIDLEELRPFIARERG